MERYGQEEDQAFGPRTLRCKMRWFCSGRSAETRLDSFFQSQRMKQIKRLHLNGLNNTKEGESHNEIHTCNNCHVDLRFRAALRGRDYDRQSGTVAGHPYSWRSVSGMAAEKLSYPTSNFLMINSLDGKPGSPPISMGGWIGFAILFRIVDLIVDISFYGIFGHIAHSPNVIAGWPQVTAPAFILSYVWVVSQKYVSSMSFESFHYWADRFWRSKRDCGMNMIRHNF